MTEVIHYSLIGKEDINFGSGTFSVTLADGSVVVMNQVPAAFTNENNDFTASQLPNVDNAVDLGSASFRWANLYVVNSIVGDLHFANGWTITEEGDGLLFLNPKRKPVLRLNEDGEFSTVKAKRRK